MPSKPIKPWIVDPNSFGLEPFLVWASTASSAKSIVRKEHAPRLPTSFYEKERIHPDWDAEVYSIPLQAEPLSEPGLETRGDVLEAAAAHVRRDGGLDPPGRE